MRRSGICPKCSSDRLLLIGAVPDTGEVETQIRELHLAVALVGHGMFGSEQRGRKGKLAAVLCQGCGHVEFHVTDPESVTVDGTYVTALPRPPTA